MPYVIAGQYNQQYIPETLQIEFIIMSLSHLQSTVSHISCVDVNVTG